MSDQLPAIVQPGALTALSDDTYIVPALIADRGDRASWRYIEFDELAPLSTVEHRRLAGLHDMLRSAHRGGRVHRHHLAGDKPVEQHPHGGKLLLNARRPVFLLQLLHPGRHVERPDGRQREPALLAPGEEPFTRAGVGSARVVVVGFTANSAWRAKLGRGPSPASIVNRHQ